MLLGVAFTVLLLLISGVSAVLSPKSVKLSCQNLNVSVSWEYSEQKPETSFRVHVGGSAGHLVSDTTEHQYDLSHFIWASEERYFGFHYVTVTAKEGGNQSESIPSRTFTFNHLKTAEISCKLDFPPVDLIENESGATVSVMNPLQFYRELKQAAKSDSAKFKFTVSSNYGDSQEACTARDKICKLSISFPEGAKKCVKTLKGWLFDGIGDRYVEFRETGPLCASKSTEVHVQLLIILLVVFAIVISVIIIVICKLKAWTLMVQPEPTPEPTPEPKLISLQLNHKEGDLRYARVSRTHISPVTLTDPSVSSGEKEEEVDLQDSGVDSRRRLLASPYAEGGLSEGYGRGEDSADDSDKTEIVSMDLEEEVEVEGEGEGQSGYDCSHICQVDMGNGDMATCYTER
ncbi:interferon gamma receptor 1 [Anarhichas minor]|uniref:interferon gamma receptor 1 n=1 Tax=Anarhichas minor TaxID=65739 RepID=UPI003F737FC9